MQEFEEMTADVGHRTRKLPHKLHVFFCHLTCRQAKSGKQRRIVQVTLCTNMHTHQGKWSLANSVGLCKLLSAQTRTHIKASEAWQTVLDCANYSLHKHAHTSRQVKPGKQCWIVQVTLCTNMHTHQGKWSLANSVGLCKLPSAQTCTHIKASEAWQTVLDCASYSLHKHAHIYTVLDCACGYLYALMKKINFSFPDMEDIRKENCLIILNVYGHAVQNHCMHPLHTVTHWINLA